MTAQIVASAAGQQRNCLKRPPFRYGYPRRLPINRIFDCKTCNALRDQGLCDVRAAERFAKEFPASFSGYRKAGSLQRLTPGTYWTPLQASSQEALFKWLDALEPTVHAGWRGTGYLG